MNPVNPSSRRTQNADKGSSLETLTQRTNAFPKNGLGNSTFPMTSSSQSSIQSAKVNSLLNTATERNLPFFILPDDVIGSFIFTALTESTDFISFSYTCTKLSQMSHVVIPSISLPPVMRLFLGIELKEFANALLLPASTQHATASDKDILWNAFKNRCAQIKVHPCSKDFVTLGLAAISDLEKKSESNSSQQTTNEISSRLKEKIFSKIIMTFANQPIEKITPENFKQIAANLKKLSPKKKVAAIEATIRNAILRKKDNAEKLTILSLDYDYPKGQKVASIREEIRTELEKKEKALKSEFDQLLSPNGTDGKIAAAKKNFKDAAQTMLLAEKLIREAFSIDNSKDCVSLMIGMIGRNELTPAMKAIYDDFETKTTNYQAAKNDYNDLSQRLNQIISFVRGQPSGGEYGKVLSDLRNLNSLVQFQSDKFSKFYAELSIEVNDSNAVVRSNALGRSFKKY